MNSRPSACAEHDLALSLHAAGALDADEAARLEAHVQGCASCRAVLDGSRLALGLARLPAPSEAERRALAPLSARVLEGLRRSGRRRALLWRGATVAGLAAALVLAVASPALLRKSEARLARERAEQEALLEARYLEEARARWQPPDVDDLWEASDVLDLEPSRARATYVDAALSSYDAGVGH